MPTRTKQRRKPSPRTHGCTPRRPARDLSSPVLVAFKPSDLGRENDSLGVYWFKRELYDALLASGIKPSNVIASETRPAAGAAYRAKVERVTAAAIRSRRWKARIRDLRADV